VPVCAQCGTENPDIAKFCLACGSALAAASPVHEYRKTVTIVFSDLKGSTAMGEKLDSESLREVMTRYFDSMSAELERHGGVVEKFIGDAIMAVFGLPKLHEDDALRAVRAAADMQRVQGELNDELERNWGVRLTVRTGVNTGEVVAGDAVAGQRLVTGDAVNVAARLEQAAGAQVPAYRLVGVREGSERQQRRDSPMIGRDHELELLSGALEAAMDTRTCRLVTIVGEAGVGKSRLIDEFVLSVEERAHVLRGRCLPYGDGITPGPGNTRSWTTGSRLPAGAVAVARPNNVTATRARKPGDGRGPNPFSSSHPKPPSCCPCYAECAAGARGSIQAC